MNRWMSVLLLSTMPAMTQAANYTVTKNPGAAGQPETYTLADAARQTEVRVAPSIGNIAYQMTVKGKAVFWSPFKTLEEFAAKPAQCGNPFLWPWANRIDGTSYYVNGKKYNFNLELGNVRAGQNNTPIHGLLLFTNKWKVKEFKADGKGAHLTSRLEFWKHPDLMAQFPFAHAVEMTYRLTNGVLEVETLVENLSTEPLPLSLGFHPWFKVNDAPRDEWTVTMPVNTRYALSPKLIPTGETVANPYGKRVPLRDVSLDDVFGDLEREASGFARFSVQGVKEKVIVEYGPKYHVAVVYSPKGRDFICFEPMTSITNAFNASQAGWYKDLQSVAPGATWREVFRISTEGY